MRKTTAAALAAVTALGLGAATHREAGGRERAPTSIPALPGADKDFEEIQWIHGSENCFENTDPAIQVEKLATNTYVLRENKCINYEAPFIYLMIGSDRALLLDSGATMSEKSFPIAARVKQILTENSFRGPLIVAHTHSHGDHVAGDYQLAAQGAIVVGKTPADVANFFGIKNWPEDTATIDLGGRKLEILPIPGHESAHIAVYDAATRTLFTGDTLYPGRLYVSNWTAFRSSVKRLYEFAKARAVDRVLGAHIEMSSKAGVDYPIGTTYQPEEHGLTLGMPELKELSDAVEKLGENAAYDAHSSFIIDP